MELTLEMVNNTVRPSFEKNIVYVDKYLKGKGLDMGCGSCPLMKLNCLHIDISPQPIAVEQIGLNFIHADVTKIDFPKGLFDYIFSSHMVEDLPNRDEMILCLNRWSEFLKIGGYIVLLIPDMQGGRYPTVEQGGNCSHKTNVGRPFFEGLVDFLSLEIVQIDTLPHESSETMDITEELK